MKKNPYPECPADELLQEIAAGITPGETVAQNAPHIVSCDFCGPLLKQYIHEFSDELTAEDTAILGQLKSSSPKWQKKLVREHVVSKNAAEGDQRSVWEKMKEFFSWPQLAGAAAVAAVIVVAAIALARRGGDDPDRLVASAYAERRTIEMRLSSVPYSQYRPFKTTLGSEGEQGAGFDRPNLSAAKAEIGKELKSSTADPKLLEAEGRIALLDGSGSAINTAKSALENARDAGLETPKLQIDLAATYFESEMKNHPGQPDLRKSMDLLKGVVDDPKLKPKDESRLSALFDLALTYEKSNQLDLARRTWEEYLQLDSSSDWAKEASAHRDRLPQSAGQPVSRRDDPAFFLKDPAAKQNAEEYMDAALIDWLPKALNEPDSNYPQALDHLADLMITEHSDFWLKDFRSRLQPGDVQAIEELSAAVQANQQDRTTDALAHARFAAAAFAKRNNIPGELRAHFEEVYAYQRRLDGSSCRTRAGPLAVRLADAKYPWLQSQTALETAICLNFLGNYSTLDNEIEISKKVAADAHLSSSLLRTLGIAAGIHRQTEKKCDKGWRDGVEGLEEYWKGIHRPENLFQFYSVMSQCAEQSEQYHAAKALLQQAIRIQDDFADNNASLNNAILRSTLYLYLANTLEVLDENAAAQDAVEKADALLDGQPEESTARKFRLTAKIRLAEIESRRNNAEVALSTLAPARALIATTTDQIIVIDYYRVLGKVYLQLRNIIEAASAYEAGIVIAENSLSTFKEPSRRLQWATATEDLYKGLIRVLLQQDRSEDAWKLWEWYKSRSMMARHGLAEKNPVTRLTWTALQQQIFRPLILPGQIVRLVYVTYEDGIELWSINGKEIRSHWIAADLHGLEKLLKRFAEACSTGASSLDELHATSQKLYTVLVAPVIADLQPQVLSLELDRALQDLPFEALRGPQGRYLVDKFPVLYSPGILIEGTLRKPALVRGSELLLQLQGSGYVPEAAIFQAAIGDFFQKKMLMAGTVTTLPAIQAALAESEIFNFIGHGKESGVNAALQIKEQPDELLLQASDIPKSLRRLKLATLSACSTGTSDDNGLLDTGNLANSFLAAGVPNVVASRWNVVSDSTQKLIGSFYRNVRHGDTAASALQKAQKELLITQDHPYYWAGFYLAGRAN